MTYPLDTVMQPGIKNLWLIYGEKLTGRRGRIRISSLEYLTMCLSLI